MAGDGDDKNTTTHVATAITTKTTNNNRNNNTQNPQHLSETTHLPRPPTHRRGPGRASLHRAHRHPVPPPSSPRCRRTCWRHVRADPEEADAVTSSNRKRRIFRVSEFWIIMSDFSLFFLHLSLLFRSLVFSVSFIHCSSFLSFQFILCHVSFCLTLSLSFRQVRNPKISYDILLLHNALEHNTNTNRQTQNQGRNTNRYTTTCSRISVVCQKINSCLMVIA